jgi:hypothetical protein
MEALGELRAQTPAGAEDPSRRRPLRVNRHEAIDPAAERFVALSPRKGGLGCTRVIEQSVDLRTFLRGFRAACVRRALPNRVDLRARLRDRGVA